MCLSNQQVSNQRYLFIPLSSEGLIATTAKFLGVRRIQKCTFEMCGPRCVKVKASRKEFLFGDQQGTHCLHFITFIMTSNNVSENSRRPPRRAQLSFGQNQFQQRLLRYELPYDCFLQRRKIKDDYFY